MISHVGHRWEDCPDLNPTPTPTPREERAARRADPRQGDGIHATFDPAGHLVDTYGLGHIPARSPYQAGDWVALHGHPGAMPWHRHGWRGFVLGGMGSTLLRGLTDDGRDWCEHWGHLDPDGTADRTGGGSCVCCPHPPRRPKPVQLNLFDVAGATS